MIMRTTTGTTNWSSIMTAAYTVLAVPEGHTSRHIRYSTNWMYCLSSRRLYTSSGSPIKTLTNLKYQTVKGFHVMTLVTCMTPRKFIARFHVHAILAPGFARQRESANPKVRAPTYYFGLYPKIAWNVKNWGPMGGKRMSLAPLLDATMYKYFGYLQSYGTSQNRLRKLVTKFWIWVI